MNDINSSAHSKVELQVPYSIFPEISEKQEELLHHERSYAPAA